MMDNTWKEMLEGHPLDKIDLDIVIIKSKIPAAGYMGFVKDIPGAASFAKTKGELKENLKDALRCLTMAR